MAKSVLLVIATLALMLGFILGRINSDTSVSVTSSDIGVKVEELEVTQAAIIEAVQQHAAIFQAIQPLLVYVNAQMTGTAAVQVAPAADPADAPEPVEPSVVQ